MRFYHHLQKLLINYFFSQQVQSRCIQYPSQAQMKIRRVMVRMSDTAEYVGRMQKELFEVLDEARSRQELKRIEPRAREVAGRYRGRTG